MLLMAIPDTEDIVYFFFVLVTTVFIGVEYWTLEDEIRRYKKHKEKKGKKHYEIHYVSKYEIPHTQNSKPQQSR